MTTTLYTPNRPGRVNNAFTPDHGTDAENLALFLKVFAGEVLTSFAETNVMLPRHFVRTIPHGKSASFPVLGKTSASYHTPGTELMGGQNVLHNERIINIDKKLISDIFVSDVDELMNHFDLRSRYSREMGAALARQWDKNCLQLIALGARAAATVTGGDAGSSGWTAAVNTDAGLFDANAHDDVADLIACLYHAAAVMDGKDIPRQNRYVAVLPTQYYMLAATTNFQSKDFGGAGQILSAHLPMVAGFELVPTNNLPTSSISQVDPGERNTYHGDFTGTVALCWHRDAIGTVKLLDLSVQQEPTVARQGTLMVARYMVGHGILRPECCVEIVNAQS